MTQRRRERIVEAARLSPALVRRLAAQADVAPATLERYLFSERPMRPSRRARIERMLQALDLRTLRAA